jgi:DNA-binding NarL/FixJ family response regulator
MPKTVIRILLVEDHEIVRMGIRTILKQERDLSIVAEAGDGQEAIDKALELNPDLILMDIGLPTIDGIKATRAIKSALPKAKIIIITSHEQEEDVFAGLGAGADGYCVKGLVPKQLVNVIRCVMDGGLWLDRLIARPFLDAVNRRSLPPTLSLAPLPASAHGLTERELQILNLLVNGFSNQEMASSLNLSTETIKSHMKHLFEKLQVTDRTQAAVKAVKEGLVPGATSGSMSGI